MQTQTTSLPSRRAETSDEDDRLLTGAAVRERLGGVSNMCIWRWSKDERVQFPQPDMVLNGRRYWRIGTLRAWEASRKKAA